MKKTIKEIADQLYQITIPMAFRLNHVQVFAAIHEPGVMLFDTGPNSPQTLSALRESLRDIGHSLEEVERIWITHFHGDHCGLAGVIQEISGGKIQMSEADFEALHFFSQKKMRMERVKSFCLAHGLDAGTADSLEAIFNTFPAGSYPFAVDRFLKERERLVMGNRVIEVLETPGHSRGHLCFFLRKEKILIAGDHILPQITPNLSPDYSLPSFRPLQSYIRSLEKIRNLPVTLVYPAHGSPFQDLKGRVEEIEEHHQQRKGLALNVIQESPRTVYEVSREIFGRDLPPFDQYLALNETYVHLLELEKERVIKQYRNGELIYFELNEHKA